MGAEWLDDPAGPGVAPPLGVFWLAVEVELERRGRVRRRVGWLLLVVTVLVLVWR